MTLRADGEVCCHSSFGTALARAGPRYFEVELLSGGVQQLGWVRLEGFQSSEQQGDGVGDDLHSWAMDGCRGCCWHQGEAVPYGPMEGEGWQKGDVVGCAVRYSELVDGQVECCLAFSLNGVSHGPAFRFTLTPSELEHPDRILTPGLSLQAGEAARVNLGQRPFRHSPPSDTSTSTSSAEPVVAPPSSSSSSSSEVAASSSSAVVEASSEVPPTPAAPEEWPEVDLEAVKDLQDLLDIGLKRLQVELQRRGLKAGGTLAERAARLWAVRGLGLGKDGKGITVPKQLLAKKNKKKSDEDQETC